MAEFRVIFVANDYDATVAFFTDVMGLEVERSFGEIFRGTILLAAAGRIEVIEDGGGWDTPGVTGVSVSWEIDDADAEHARSGLRRCHHRSTARVAAVGSQELRSGWTRRLADHPV